MAEPIKETTRLADRLEEMDAEILAWAKLTRRKLLEKLISLGVEDKIKLAKSRSRIRRNTKSGKFEKQEFLTKSLTKSLRRKGGDIEAVGFSFAQHGIFLERGVGRSRPIGSAGASAAAKPWLGPVIPPSIEELADLLEDKYADIAAAELRIVIPGVLNTTVSGG